MPTTLEELNRHVTALASTESPSEVLALLTEASSLAASRAAIFLVRQGTVKGWAGRGYAPDALERLRGLVVDRQSWIGGLAEAGDGHPGLDRPGRGQGPPEFGQPAAEDAVALPVRVAGRVVAILLAEAAPGDAWAPEILPALVAVVSLRLELDLALRRKAKAATAPRAEASPDEATAPTADPTPVGLTPAPEKRVPSPDEALLEEARRFARLVATDIRLYNEETVMLGRQNGDLGVRLAEQLEQGEKTFRRRFPDMGDQGDEVLRDAYVQVLGAGNADAFK
ncbi:MAG: hypothetical protein R3344_03920 [Acidobacteriota bacterium]|nr:hypothetical protein [Acidobacteriota bacterium]